MATEVLLSRVTPKQTEMKRIGFMQPLWSSRRLSRLKELQRRREMKSWEGGGGGIVVRAWSPSLNCPWAHSIVTQL